MGTGIEICALTLAHWLCAVPTAIGEAAGAWAASPEFADFFGMTSLGLLAAAAAISDLRVMRVPDWITGSIGLCGVTWQYLSAENWAAFQHAGLAALAGMVACATALLLLREVYFRQRGRDGLGLGDVKLCAAAALWMPLDLLAVAILVASTAALLSIFLVQFAGGGWQASRKIPLAAYLAPAIWLSWCANALIS